MIDYVKEQKEIMKKILKETLENQKNLEKLVENDKNVDTNIYGLDLIEKAHLDMEKKINNFDKDLNKIQKHKFNFQITVLVLFIIISLVGVAGYWIRKVLIPWIASILLLLFAAPVFIIAGLETTYTFLSIDFCSSIGNSVISGIIPSDNKGLGTYLSCPPKETIWSISTANYDYISNFDYLYNETEFIFSNRTWLKDLSLGTDKRNNAYFKELYEKVEKIELPTNKTIRRDDDEEKKGLVLRNLKCFGIMNVIMAGLLSMTSCYTARNSINFIEEKYCYNNHGYMFRNVIFDMISAIGFIIISVGLNKLIKTMETRFAKVYRGKKEFNDDIINNEDD